jgi:hypothetical protein
LRIQEDYYFVGSFFFRRLLSPKIMPINTTTTIRMPKAMTPVVSAYTVLEIGEAVGVSVGAGVGIQGASVAGGGRREAEGGVGVGPSGGRSAAEVEVGNSSLFADDRPVL